MRRRRPSPKSFCIRSSASFEGTRAKGERTWHPEERVAPVVLGRVFVIASMTPHFSCECLCRWGCGRKPAARCTFEVTASNSGSDKNAGNQLWAIRNTHLTSGHWRDVNPRQPEVYVVESIFSFQVRAPDALRSLDRAPEGARGQPGNVGFRIEQPECRESKKHCCGRQLYWASPGCHHVA